MAVMGFYCEPAIDRLIAIRIPEQALLVILTHLSHYDNLGTVAVRIFELQSASKLSLNTQQCYNLRR